MDDALGASDRRERLREVARLVAWCTTAEELARLAARDEDDDFPDVEGLEVVAV